MYPLENLVDMLRRDLADYTSELNFTFLLNKLADSAAELSFYLSSIELIETGNSYYLLNEPSHPVKRLISLNAAIDYIASEYATVRKTSETISEPGLSYSYSSASNVLRVCLEALLKKRDELFKALTTDATFSSEYLDLIEVLKRKDLGAFS